MRIIVLVLNALSVFWTESIAHRMGKYIDPNEDSKDKLSVGVVIACMVLGALWLTVIAYLVTSVDS